jgi:hypothetical protein
MRGKIGSLSSVYYINDVVCNMQAWKEGEEESEEGR